MHSSVHPQNATMKEFLSRQPSAPKPLDVPRLPPTSSWKQPRKELLHLLDLDASANELNKLETETQNLIFSTIDICKSSVCPTALSSRFFLRIVDNLLTSMVSGTGEPSLTWANPAAATPLRVHAFASFLQLLNSCSNYLTKSGVRQLDGKGKWNMTTASRLMSLLFDEDKLFVRHHGEDCEEPVDVDTWFAPKKDRKVKPDPKIRKPKLGRSFSDGRSRHVRSDSDNLIFSSKVGEHKASGASSFDFGAINFDTLDISGDSSLKDKSTTLPSGSFEDALSSLKQASPKPTEIIYDTAASPAEIEWTSQRVDTKEDFQNALMAASDDFSSSAEAMSPLGGGMLGGGGIALSGRRKWMTLPSSALATIREDAADNGAGMGQLNRVGSNEPSKDPLNNKGKKSSVKQMRIPSRKRDSAAPKTPPSQPSPAPGVDGKPVASGEEIEPTLTAFLDVIGENLGYS